MCSIVNYVKRRICALQGSSVNISSEYSYPYNKQPKSKFWYKTKRSGEEEAEKRVKAVSRRVEYHDKMKNHHILTIKKLRKNDSAEYTFRLQQHNEGWKQSDLPGVILIVTDLRVKFTPSAEVTEGQRVTLTCSTSCPLTDDTNYLWYMNSRPLTLPEKQTKHLVLDPVSSQHAGKYSCAVQTHNISSSEKTLTVKNKMGKWTPAAAAGVCAVLLVIIPLPVFLWIRKKRTSRQSRRTETSDNMEQLNPGPVYDEISAQPTERDDLHYSTVHFSKKLTDHLYSTVQPHQPREQEHVHYAVVNFRHVRSPE
ncbi:carcinoembryonic antigen-related cell adhesion molecule 2-like [Lates calcarifer]|uniref:Carcinoembryonic antigen-related cell adhesion molecule 2-like n=1 Tax=Lates calcarifer TaxID=8187 RepID=A0AAJ7V6T1_LATCA|nr:carcinoembryonic antigen-related cell adhesion molecule 2-like [Lates calcarifer]